MIELSIEEARVCVTGYDHNRPDDFPGLGDFIGWAGGVERLPDGDLLFVHSAGYWHVSFATPHAIKQELKQQWAAEMDFDPEHEAPTGGRIMAERSSDNGKTWSRPFTIYDGPIDTRPSDIFVTSEGTVLLIVNMQASWYGFEEAPEGYQELNTRQLVMRSTDSGQSWSEPTPLHSSGTYYTRCRSHCLELADGGILLATYDVDKDSRSRLYGTIHRSDDDGRSWQVISHIRREGQDLDEADWVQLASGRIVLITRPDGAVFVSDDQGVSWEEIANVRAGYFYAPSVIELADDTLVCTAGSGGGQSVFLSSDGGQEWSDAITVDPSAYGYGKLFRDRDESILLGYAQSGRAPNRCWLVRFRVNAQRDGITLLPIAQ